jgi:hypothetical protein
MTHAHRSLLTGICTCLLSSFAIAAAPAAPATQAAAPPGAGAKQAGAAAPAATAEAPPPAKSDAAPQKKPSRGSSDARKCLKQPDNKGVRRCAEKYR